MPRPVLATREYVTWFRRKGGIKNISTARNRGRDRSQREGAKSQIRGSSKRGGGLAVG